MGALGMVRAVAAELARLYLVHERDDKTFLETVGLHDGAATQEIKTAAAARVLFSPLQAEIAPKGGEAYRHDIGVGYTVTQEPAEAAHGGELGVRSWTVEVVFTARARLVATGAKTESSGYEALLTASEWLASRGGVDGMIGGHADPLDASTERYTVTAMEWLDNGESGQFVDENGDYTLSRGFTLTTGG